MVPLVVYIIATRYRGDKTKGSKKTLKHLVLWFMPVALIPLLWPFHAISLGQFNEWHNGIFWQATGRIDKPLWEGLSVFFIIDPIVIILGIAGLIFATIRRDYLLLLWVIPFLILLQIIGYVSYWFFIPILPALCVGAARLIMVTVTTIANRKKNQKILLYSVTSAIIIFGVANSSILMSMNLNSYHLGVAVIVSKLVEQSIHGNNVANSIDSGNTLTVIGYNFWLWIPKYIIDKNNQNEYMNFYEKDKTKTERVLLIAGEGFDRTMTRPNRTEANILELRDIFNSTHILATMEERIKRSPEAHRIIDLDPSVVKRVDIRVNY
jgi:hypothetical protein